MGTTLVQEPTCLPRMENQMEQKGNEIEAETTEIGCCPAPFTSPTFEELQDDMTTVASCKIGQILNRKPRCRSLDANPEIF